MSALSIQPTFPIFTDIDGQPLEAGYVWIGQANLDPQVNPINVYWDAALTISAPQPIRTLGGYPSRNGTPARLYVNSDYSIRVQNRNGSTVYSAPEATERFGSELISYQYPDANSYPRTVSDRLAEEASILDFIPAQYHAAIQDGTSAVDVSQYVQVAIGTGQAIFWPAGTYIVNNVNNDNAPTKRVMWRGDSASKVILKTTARQNYVLRIGNPDDSWGSGGGLSLSEMSFRYGERGWDTLVGNPDIGLLTLYRVSNVRVYRLSMFGSNNCGIYTNSMGYSSFTECNIGGHRYDCINFDSTDLNLSVTSVLVESCQINTGLRSSVRIKDGFNITVTQCQLEDSGCAVLIAGTDNRSLVITENYIEATRGNFDIDAGSAAGVQFTITNNYIFGTPDIATINLPLNSESNFQPLTWFGNFPSGNYAVNGSLVTGQTGINTRPEAFSDITWMQGSRSVSGLATLTGAYAWNSGQQTSTIRADMALGFGAGIRGQSTTGAAYFGLLRGAAFDNTDVNTRGYLALEYENRGAINTAPTDNYALHIFGGPSPRSQQSLKCSHVGGTVLYTGGLGNSMTGTPNAADTALFLNQVNATSRSINAAGTINASGADYAEYMTKAGDFAIAKGDICGINANGLLTNVFADAVSFMVKSTSPSYVGGDTWGNCDDIGQPPERPSRGIVIDQDGNPLVDENGEALAEPIDQYEARFAQFESDYAAWDAKFQVKRAKVDRVAFAGQVPVNVIGATPGQYIVPVNDNGHIKGMAVSSPTFEQYQAAVGKVIAIEDDGRARIIVKVA
jgi:hypothetical protein